MRLNDCFLVRKAKIRKGKRDFLILDADIYSNPCKELYMLMLDNNTILDAYPLILARQVRVNKIGKFIKIKVSFIIRKPLKKPVS